MKRCSPALALACALILAVHASPAAGAGTIKAAYFYAYMPSGHLDSLAACGFNRAIVHWIADSLDARGRDELHALSTRAGALGIEFVPEWLVQSPAFLSLRPPERRYTHRRGIIETEAACPLDSTYWRRALFDRAEEFLAAEPALARVAVDLEIWRGDLHHYDAGPCRCPACLAAYTAGVPRLAGRNPERLSGLIGWEESRLTRTLLAMMREFAGRHPGVAIDVLDLDLDSFVHRALARSLTLAGLATTDYCEKSYSAGEAPLAEARARLDALGLRDAPLVGGIWLKKFRPADLVKAVGRVRSACDGWFAFTTYSLWLEPGRLSGPYTLPAAPGSYWPAMREVNR